MRRIDRGGWRTSTSTSTSTSTTTTTTTTAEDNIRAVERWRRRRCWRHSSSPVLTGVEDTVEARRTRPTLSTRRTGRRRCCVVPPRCSCHSSTEEEPFSICGGGRFFVLCPPSEWLLPCRRMNRLTHQIYYEHLSLLYGCIARIHLSSVTGPMSVMVTRAATMIWTMMLLLLVCEEGCASA